MKHVVIRYIQKMEWVLWLCPPLRLSAVHLHAQKTYCQREFSSSSPHLSTLPSPPMSAPEISTKHCNVISELRIVLKTWPLLSWPNIHSFQLDFYRHINTVSTFINKWHFTVILIPFCIVWQFHSMRILANHPYSPLLTDSRPYLQENTTPWS